MLVSFTHNLARLLNVSGRESRALFWPYAASIIALTIITVPFLILPTLYDSLSRMQRFAAEHPELSTVESGPGHYSVTIQGYHPELMPGMQGLILGIGAVALAAVVLLAAAVSRRLHDRNRTALIGLVPLVFLAMGFWLMPRLVGSFAAPQPDLRLFPLLFLNNLLYLASLVFLVVQLASPGTDGPNRFGRALGD
jgi:uncharacterized membrane protein YhaH (DUF805 family)